MVARDHERLKFIVPHTFLRRTLDRNEVFNKKEFAEFVSKQNKQKANEFCGKIFV